MRLMVQGSRFLLLDAGWIAKSTYRLIPRWRPPSRTPRGPPCQYVSSDSGTFLSVFARLSCGQPLMDSLAVFSTGIPCHLLHSAPTAMQQMGRYNGPPLASFQMIHVLYGLCVEAPPCRTIRVDWDLGSNSELNTADSGPSVYIQGQHRIMTSHKSSSHPVTLVWTATPWTVAFTDGGTTAYR